MAIINNVVGTNIEISDSNGDRIIDLELQGDTTQDGTPTPDAPVEVQTVTGRQVINICKTNLLRNNLEIVKANNTGGTWNDNVYTYRGVSFTYNSDGSITATGQATENTYFYISRTGNVNYKNTTLYAGTYYLTSHETTGSNTTWKTQYQIEGTSYNVFGTGNNREREVQVSTDTTIQVVLVIYSGYNPNGATFYPMIAKESGIDYEQWEVQNYEINLGKNLCNGTSIGSYVTSAGVITANTTGNYISTPEKINVAPNTTYTITFVGYEEYKNMYVAEWNNNTFLSRTNYSTLTFTTSATTNYVYIYLYNSNAPFTTYDTQIQIEKGSQASSYSPYKEPIELCKIDTYQNRIFKSSGRNKFDYENAELLYRSGVNTPTTINNGLKVLINSDGSTKYAVFNLGKTKDLKGKTIRVKCNFTASGTNVSAFRLSYCNESGGGRTTIQTGSTSGTTISTGVIDETKTNVALMLLANNSSTTTEVNTMYTEFTNIMITIDDEDMSYEPYGNNWYIEKQIGKVVLDGSQVWSRASARDGYRFTCNIVASEVVIPSTTSVIGSLLSDRFKGVSANDTANSINGIAIASSGNLVIYYDALKNETATNFNNWVRDNNINVYYALKTPTYTEITDSELINQLNNVATMVLPYKNAYITSSSENLPAILDIDYFTQDRYIRESDRQALIDGIATIPYKINVIKDGSIIKTLDQRSIVNIDYEDYRYVDTSSLVIGQFVARKITGSLDKIYTDFEIEDTELNIQMGVQVNNTTNYYDLGNFLVTKPTNNNVKDKTNFEAMDYTKKFNVVFDGTRLTYPCNAQDLAVECCRQAGVELATHIFTNCEFIIEDNQYVENETCRKVMQDIGKLAYSWVRIDWDNKCYIDFDPQDYILDENKLTNHNYYDLSLQNNVFGPVNRVVLGMENVEGENVVIEDSASIAANGVTEIQLYDSNITYTEELRQQAIVNATKLFGLTFTPLDTNTTGHPWLIGKEKIQVTTMDGTNVYTYPFDRTIAYMGHIKTKLTSKAETKTETEYKNKATLENTVRQTRIIVDKQNGEINLAVTTANNAQSTANTANSTANTAKSTATTTQNNLNTLINTTLPQTYYTKSEIDVSEGAITAMVAAETSRGSIVSKINLVPGEIALEGTVTANNNFKVLTDGSIEAKNGSFSGDIFLGSGGKVIGGDGLLTNLQFQSVGIIDGWSPLGFNIDDQTNVLYQDLEIDYNIPSNFTIKEAKLTLYCTKVMSSYWNPSTGQSTDTTGVPKQLRLFKGLNNQTHQIFWGTGTSYFYRNDMTLGSVITNAFGSSSYSPSISSVGQVVAKDTIDLKSSLSTSTGNNSLVIRTNVTKPANFNTAANRQTIAEATGMARAVLNIIGYMSTSA